MRRQTKYRRFTYEEKRNHYLEWKKSGQSKVEFCQSVGISKSTFFSWVNQFKDKIPDDVFFSPVTLKSAPTSEPDKVTQLEIHLPNQTRLFITIQKPNLISFIQELCHATTVIR
jgi:transposase-like protein